jgi:hypothetical protein
LESEVRCPKLKKINKTMMKFKFEKLIIWQKAMDYGESIFRLSHSSSDFGLPTSGFRLIINKDI